MQRRQFIAAAGAALGSGGLLLAGCTTTRPGSSDLAADNAAARSEIDAGVDATLAHLHKAVPGSRELTGRAGGVLVFPSVVAAGFWVGGHYGRGALRIAGRTSGYFSTVAGSFGAQVGIQSKALIFAFMTTDALERFMRSSGWSAGADATVALVKMGANGKIDTTTATSPVEAFVLTNMGLMAGVSLEGTKVNRLVI